jgi:DNA-binding CsgD family transcriptional regulator
MNASHSASREGPRGRPPATGGPVLLEREAPRAALEEQLAAVRGPRGRLVLLAGEAGIGKSALVRAFADAHGGPERRILWGGCDALHTPRPLGPLVDVAEQTGGELAEVVARGAAPGPVLGALADELRRRPSVLILEDLHWADEATLDLLRLVARRIDRLPALVVVTYRDDELHRAHPLRIALGDLPAAAAHRIVLAPLTLTAVTTLTASGAAAAAIDPAELHRRSAGNPFYVGEVLAAGGDDRIPATVRDAVLARASRLDGGARALLDAVAIEPARAELWLLHALTDPGAEAELDAALDAALASGMLRADGHAVAFRHEIARAAIADAIPPHRRMLLHRRALGALTAAIGRRPDLARLAHHAEAADDPDAVLRYAPAAGERAAALRSHREAAAQFARALRCAGDVEPARRAALLERRSYECYLTDRIADAIEARRAAMGEHRAAGDRRREGDAHRWLSRLAWFAGDNATAEAEARLAVELLEPLGPGPELAMAYSNVAQLRMLFGDDLGAIAWGERAIALATELGEDEILVHALNNVGTAERHRGVAGGAEKQERSLALALAGDYEEHVARAYTNLATMSVEAREYAAAARWLEEGIAYCADHDLDSWLLYMSGIRARVELDRGAWDAAAQTAAAVLGHPQVAAPSRVTPLVVLGRVRARRGDPHVWAPLDEALALARGTGELQRIGPVATARAEARWLAGEDALVAGETDAALALALEQADAWAGELLLWRRRAGIVEAAGAGDAPALVLPAPLRLERDGRAEDAAAAWAALGCPYDAALALAQAPEEDARRRALAALQQLGAGPAARRVGRALRQGGARDVRHGPRAATRASPSGLTARELDVLLLVAEGRRNAEIAARLFLSERTVGHHVSAILRKLGVASRGQAAAEARKLGISPDVGGAAQP